MDFFFNLVKFIKWKIYDLKHPIPNRPYGVKAFVGLGGSGKTLSMCEYLDNAPKIYKGVKIYTNFNYINQDGQLDNWRQLLDITSNNGVIFAIDEIQVTFERKGWANFPTELLNLLTQNRKKSVQFIFSTQDFDVAVIDVRRMTQEVVFCSCLAGRWVFQKAYYATQYRKNIESMRTPPKKAWSRNFVATNKLFHSYDTYKIIESLRKEIVQKDKNMDD